MKDKIMYLIIGILIGAIIATICFYFYNKNNVSNMPKMDGNRPQMMQGGPGDRILNKNSNEEIPQELPSNEKNKTQNNFNNNEKDSNNDIQTDSNTESVENS